jgi:Tfp pilus assembly protein PilN
MIRRFDHRAASRASALAPLMRRFAVREEEYPPLAAFAGTLALIIGLSAIEHARLASVEADLAHDRTHLVQSDRDVAQLKRLDATLQEDRHEMLEISRIQASGSLRANDIVAIGNRLPSDTWASVIRHEDNSLTLEGQARHVAAVGAALIALGASDLHNMPSLISIDEGSGTHADVVRYALRMDIPRK